MNQFLIFWNELRVSQVWQESIATIIIISTSIVFYTIASFFVRSQEWSASRKHNALVTTRSWLIFVVIIGVLLTWRGEIRTFLFSISAIFVGLIIAFKEIILSFSASLLITYNKWFNVGEYIEIDSIRGQVIDRDFVHTKVLSHESNTLGRELLIPNSLFLTSKMQNLSRPSHIGIYHLEVASTKENAIADGDKLLKAAQQITKEYDDIYIQNVKKSEVWQGHIPDHLFIRFDLKHELMIKLFFPAPHKKRFAVEQQILKKFLEN